MAGLNSNFSREAAQYYASQGKYIEAMMMFSGDITKAFQLQEQYKDASKEEQKEAFDKWYAEQTGEQEDEAERLKKQFMQMFQDKKDAL